MDLLYIMEKTRRCYANRVGGISTPGGSVFQRYGKAPNRGERFHFSPSYGLHRRLMHQWHYYYSIVGVRSEVPQQEFHRACVNRELVKAATHKVIHSDTQRY